MQSAYAKFVKANDALAKCMAAQSAEKYGSLSAAEQDKVCAKEASAVRDILSRDELSFRSLLSQRIAAMKAQQ